MSLNWLQEKSAKEKKSLKDFFFFLAQWPANSISENSLVLQFRIH